MKYRQRGYKEDERDDEGRRGRRDNKKDDLGNRHQMRSLRHAIDREVTVVTRCGRCGYQVPTSHLDVIQNTLCPKCQTPLHSCRHCKMFDTSSRFECREPVDARIADKWAANDCQYYKPVQALDATGRRAKAPEDARAAFHSLFKS